MCVFVSECERVPVGFTQVVCMFYVLYKIQPISSGEEAGHATFRTDVDKSLIIYRAHIAYDLYYMSV